MSDTTAPRLVVSSGSERGRVLTLVRARSSLGRSDDCELRLDDPMVSRHHAEMICTTEGVLVADAGSTHGTWVNGSRVTGTVELRNGDVVTVGGVRLRYDAAAPTPGWSPSTGSSFTNNANLTAATINQVGGNQYVLQQRDSFLRDVAATRSRARWLVWIGLGMSVAGYALYGSVVFGMLSSFGRVFSSIDSNTEPDPGQLFGQFGSPLIPIGVAMALAGAVLLVVGVVLHIVAAARRRQVERIYPLPAHHEGGRR